MRIINNFDISNPTRPATGSIIIDHVLDPMSNNNYVVNLIKGDISDHNIIILEIDKTRKDREI